MAGLIKRKLVPVTEQQELLMSNKTSVVTASTDDISSSKSYWVEHQDHNLQGAIPDVLIALSLVSLPMILLTGILLGLVFYYEIKPSRFNLPGVPDPYNTDATAFLVDFSATKLVTVASWTSSTTSLLPPFAMVLLSYPVARSISEASQRGNKDELPSPYQFGLLLELLGGNVGSLWSWIRYRRWRTKERTTSSLRVSFYGLVFVTVLGVSIIAADTWLHATTTTVFIQQALPRAVPNLAFGRGFYDRRCSENIYGCFNRTAGPCPDDIYPCTVSRGNHGTMLINGPQAFATLANTSVANSVASFQWNNQTYAMLTSPSLDRQLTFQASTFAAATKCNLIGRKCSLRNDHSASTPFNCTSSFSGDLGITTSSKYSYGSWAVAGAQFFQDEDLSKNFSGVAGASMLGDTYTTTNPVYVGAYGIVPGFGGGIRGEPDTIGTYSQELGFVIGCKLTFYDLDYMWYNGTVSVQNMTTSNGTVAKVFTAPFVTQLADMMGLAQSAAGQVNTLGFTRAWENGFSSMVLGMSAGIISSRTNIIEQRYTSKLVARVPKAPLIALVTLNLVYATTGIVFAVLAVMAKPSRVKDFQGRLNIATLAAASFENQDISQRPVRRVEDMFAEKDPVFDDGRKKVAFIRSERGGWRYETL